MKLRTEASSHMPRSLHRGSSAGASGSATSGVTTRHCGALSSASPCSSCTLSLRGGLPGPGRRGAGASGGAGGSALGRLLHARGGRVLLAGGADASASVGGVCSCGGDAAAISGELRGGSAVSGGWGLGGGHGGEGRVERDFASGSSEVTEPRASRGEGEQNAAGFAGQGFSGRVLVGPVNSTQSSDFFFLLDDNSIVRLIDTTTAATTDRGNNKESEIHKEKPCHQV